MGVPETSEKPTPCRLETIKKRYESMPAVSASLSADPVFNPRNDATVDIRSLKETEEVSERFMLWWDNSLAINALR